MNKLKVNYKEGEFGWFLPTRNPKAILVLVPGSGGDGRDMLHWKFFRDWSKKNNVALLGCSYQDIDPSMIEGYADAKTGSGQMLLDEIERKAKENTNRDFLVNLPIFIWGFSAGGQFSYEMACFAPNRIKAFVVNKGGFYYTALATKATREIPSLWFYGQHDDNFRQCIIAGICLMNKRAGAQRWELRGEPVGHDVGNSIHESLEFFDGILAELELT